MSRASNMAGPDLPLLAIDQMFLRELVIISKSGCLSPVHHRRNVECI